MNMENKVSKVEDHREEAEDSVIFFKCLAEEEDKDRQVPGKESQSSYN